MKRVGGSKIAVFHERLQIIENNSRERSVAWRQVLRNLKFSCILILQGVLQGVLQGGPIVPNSEMDSAGKSAAREWHNFSLHGHWGIEKIRVIKPSAT